MPKTGESKMVERATTPQARVNTRALEIASRADARMDAHEQVCTERYKNLADQFGDVKGDIKELGDDAKAAIGVVSDRQDNNHRTNTEQLSKITEALNQLTQKVAVGQGKLDGANGAGAFLLKVLPILLATSTLAYLIFGRHP